MRTEFTCPRCREYDSFEAKPLRGLEGFKKLAGATLYVCTNCDCAIMPSEEFSSDDIPDIPLIWPDEELAISALLELERSYSGKKRLLGGSFTKLENHPELIAALESISRINLDVASAAEFIEDEFSQLLRFVNVASFNHYARQEDGPPTYAIAIKGDVVVYRSPEAHNRCVYRIGITPMPANYASSGGREIEPGRVIEFSRTVEPLVFSQTTHLSSFLRIMFAPADFFTVMLDRLGRAMASEAANDDAWVH